MNLLNIRQTAEAVGVSYSRLYYALLKQTIKPTQTVAGAAAFSESDIPALKLYFSNPHRKAKQ